MIFCFAVLWYVIGFKCFLIGFCCDCLDRPNLTFLLGVKHELCGREEGRGCMILMTVFFMAAGHWVVNGYQTCEVKV